MNCVTQQIFLFLNNLFKPKYKLIKNIQQLFVSLRHFEYQYIYTLSSHKFNTCMLFENSVFIYNLNVIIRL